MYHARLFYTIIHMICPTLYSEKALKLLLKHDENVENFAKELGFFNEMIISFSKNKTENPFSLQDDEYKSHNEKNLHTRNLYKEPK